MQTAAIIHWNGRTGWASSASVKLLAILAPTPSHIFCYL
jgi:hypothetical protein